MRNLCDNADHTGDTYAYSGNRKRDRDCGERYRDKLFGERDSSSAEITARPGSQMAGQRATFSVVARGTALLSCRWQKNLTTTSDVEPLSTVAG